MEAKECLSVVMPVYNEEKSIVEIINRVLKQPEVGELIAVNPDSLSHKKRIISHTLLRLNIKAVHELFNCEVHHFFKLIEEKTDIVICLDSKTRQIN